MRVGKIFENAKQQMESMGEQPVSNKRFIAVFQIMQKSAFRDKYIYTESIIWFIFSSENLHAVDFNTLEQRIPLRAVLNVDHVEIYNSV